MRIIPEHRRIKDLEAAHAQINEAGSEEGYWKLSTPWPTAPYASDCLECHAGVMERAFSTDLCDLFPDCHGEARNLQASPDLEVCSDCH